MNSRKEWPKARRNGIGASDIAAVLGISPWATPLELFLEKTGELPPQEDTPILRRGRRLEPVIIEFYEEETGHTVTRQQDRVIGVEPWMMATLDGYDVAANAPVEVKSVNAFAAHDFGDHGSDDVPLHYAAQVHWQVMLTGAETGYLAALIGSDDFRIFELRRDRDLEQMLVARAREFWQRVIDRRPPEPTTALDVSLLYPRDRGAILEASQELARQVETLKQMRAAIKGDEARADHLATQIKIAMGDAATLLGADGKPIAIWKSNKDSQKIDWEAAYYGLAEYEKTEDEAVQRFVEINTVAKPGARPLLLK